MSKQKPSYEQTTSVERVPNAKVIVRKSHVHMSHRLSRLCLHMYVPKVRGRLIDVGEAESIIHSERVINSHLYHTVQDFGCVSQVGLFELKFL